MIMAADRKRGADGAGDNNGINDTESLLTVENVKEFENSIPLDDGMAGFMGQSIAQTTIKRGDGTVDHEGGVNASMEIPHEFKHSHT